MWGWNRDGQYILQKASAFEVLHNNLILDCEDKRREIRFQTLIHNRLGMELTVLQNFGCSAVL